MDKVFYNEVMRNKIDNSIRFSEIYNSLDCKTLKKFLNNFTSLKCKYNIYEEGIINNIIFDINEAIEKCDLSDTQKTRLELWMDGYTENDIANFFGVSRWVVSKSIVVACDKILRYLKGFR